MSNEEKSKIVKSEITLPKQQAYSQPDFDTAFDAIKNLETKYKYMQDKYKGGYLFQILFADNRRPIDNKGAKTFANIIGLYQLNKVTMSVEINKDLFVTLSKQFILAINNKYKIVKPNYGDAMTTEEYKKVEFILIEYRKMIDSCNSYIRPMIFSKWVKKRIENNMNSN